MGHIAMTATTFGSAVIKILGPDVAAEALFSASIRHGSVLTGEVALAELGKEVACYGPRGVAARVAFEFGDHPETAVSRMVAVLATIAALRAEGGEN
jgi:hypothetical protein